MRICYFAPSDWIHTQRVVRAMLERGHEAHVVNQYGGECLPGVPVHVFGSGRNRRGETLRRIWQVKALMRRLRPDLVHGIYAHPTLGSWAAVAGVRPMLLTFLGSDILRTAHRPARWWDRRLYLRAMRDADVLIADTPQCFSEASKLTALRGRQAVIRYGTDLELFSPGPCRRITRAQLDIPEKAPVIFCPRGIGEIYNHLTMIRALPRIRQAFPGVICMFKLYYNCGVEAGRQYEQEMRRCCAESGVEAGVRFAQAASYADLPDLYRMSDVAVSIPTEDALPVTFFEAMSVGCPVVTGMLPSYEQVIVPGANAVTVDSSSPESVADGVIAVLKDADLRLRICSAGRETVREKGDFRREMDRLDELYASLLATKRMRQAG